MVYTDDELERELRCIKNEYVLWSKMRPRTEAKQKERAEKLRRLANQWSECRRLALGVKE